MKDVTQLLENLWATIYVNFSDHMCLPIYLVQKLYNLSKTKECKLFSLLTFFFSCLYKMSFHNNMEMPLQDDLDHESQFRNPAGEANHH